MVGGVSLIPAFDFAFALANALYISLRFCRAAGQLHAEPLNGVLELDLGVFCI